MRAKQPATADELRRVFRGGSWHYTSATVVRAAYRSYSNATFRYLVIGFRTAQTGCRQVLKEQP